MVRVTTRGTESGRWRTTVLSPLRSVLLKQSASRESSAAPFQESDFWPQMFRIWTGVAQVEKLALGPEVFKGTSAQHRQTSWGSALIGDLHHFLKGVPCKNYWFCVLIPSWGKWSRQQHPAYKNVVCIGQCDCSIKQMSQNQTKRPGLWSQLFGRLMKRAA